MKIVFIEWPCFGGEDIKEAFMAEGHEIVCFPYDAYGDLRKDPAAEHQLQEVLHKEHPDAVFSFDYFPVISDTCQKEHIRYISWIYDSPYVLLYSRTVLNPCNTVYVFDKELYMEFHNAGVNTVQYMPLAVNIERLDIASRREGKEGLAKRRPFLYDVSFVGALYTESDNFFDSMTGLGDYARGYLDGVMAAQMKIQGYNFVEEVLHPVMEDLYKAYPLDVASDGMESQEWIYAQYVVNRKITALERADLLTSVAGSYGAELFTHDTGFARANLRNHGVADYYEQMPRIFRQSKINLNITLRSIKSGIPLRAFDIMGCGGFLLSNFQADFLDLFVPGEDFVFYESKEDLLRKTGYYLAHEAERKAIAENGYRKVAANHTYRHRVREMLDF